MLYLYIIFGYLLGVFLFFGFFSHLDEGTKNPNPNAVAAAAVWWPLSVLAFIMVFIGLWIGDRLFS